MIPNLDLDLNDNIKFDFTIDEMTSRTFRLNSNTYRIEGMIDGIAAVKQSVYLILYTERYNWLIYSWNYGIELLELFGEPIVLIIPELERRIKEALIQDDRIIDVNDFNFVSIKNNLCVTFTVESIYGKFEYDFTTEVKI